MTRSATATSPVSARYRGRSVPPSCATLLDVLAHRANATPDKVGFLCLEDGERPGGTLTFGELYRRQQQIAGALQERDLTGRRVLMFYLPGLDFVSAFFGCMAAGAVPIAVPPPLPTERTERIHAIVNDASAGAVLCSSQLEPLLAPWLAEDPRLAALPRIATDRLEVGMRAPVSVDRESLAFLQYTSGSTSLPRGVEIRHRNLLANLESIQGPIRLGPDSVSVTWLPIFHDMGLINGVLAPVYVGCVSVMMSPLDFVRDPARWLRAISNHRGTHSGGPNFAYDLCARKLTDEQCAALDLSSWRQAYLSAEPVHADTLERFERRFASSGFNRAAWYPCYGLAEATLAVTGGALDAPPVLCKVDKTALETGQIRDAAASDPAQDVCTLVGCGSAGLDTRVLVVDAATRAVVADDVIGEVWVQGPSIADAYLGKPDESQEILRARLASGEGPFLRTGDLGFLRSGELFLVGRNKDMLIIRGRNYHPHDLEWSIGQLHPALRAGCAAAFIAGSDADPRLVLAQEARPLPDLPIAEITSEIRQTVSEQFGLRIHHVVLTRPGGIPRTSSGKIQRRRCRELFEAGTMDEIGRG